MSEGLFRFAIRRPAGLILALPIAALFLAPPAYGETIKIGGSGTPRGVMILMANSYMKAHPADKIMVLPSLGSSGGVRAALAGAIQLGYTARPLKKSEVSKGAAGIEFSRTPLIMATSNLSAPDNLALSQLAQIYSGAMTKWPDGSPIRLVMRRQYESSIVALRGISPEIRRAVEKSYSRKGLKYVKNDQENADTIERLPGALGVTTLGQLLSEGRKLKPLGLAGAVPGAKALADGTYPYLKRQFLVISSKAKVHPAARRLIDFVFSEGGRKILTQTRHMIIPRKGNR